MSKTRRQKDTLSNQLRRAIDESGMSRYAICKACGIDQASMSRFMAGRVGLLLDPIERLADFLDLELVKRTKRKGK